MEEQKRTHEKDKRLLYDVVVARNAHCHDTVKYAQRKNNQQDCEELVGFSALVLFGRENECQKEPLDDSGIDHDPDDRGENLLPRKKMRHIRGDFCSPMIERNRRRMRGGKKAEKTGNLFEGIDFTPRPTVYKFAFVSKTSRIRIVLRHYLLTREVPFW